MSFVRGIIAIIFGLMAIFWPHLTFALFFYIFGVFAIVEGCLLIINGFAQSNASSRRAASQPGTYQQGYQSGQTPPGTPYQRTTGPAAYQSPERREEATQSSPPPQGTTHQRGPAGLGSAGGLSSLAHLYGARAHHANPKTLIVIGAISVICGILCLVLPAIVGALAIYAVAAWALFEGIGALVQIQNRGWVMGLIGVLAIILALVLFFNPLGAIRSFLWIVGAFSLIMGISLIVRGITHNATATHKERPLEPGY
jgi:uncharacterized membrane protein HdeD (DUF308 family)